MGIKTKIINVLRANTTLKNGVSLVYNTLFGTTAWRFRAKNKISTKGAFLRNVKFSIQGRDNEIFIGSGTRLRKCQITIIGNNCRVAIGAHSIVNCTKFLCEDRGSSIQLGSHFSNWSGSFSAMEGRAIKVGDDCLFSDDIEVRNSDSHSIIQLDNNRQRINQAQDVVISDRVWVCAHVRLLKGSGIPSDSIVGNSAIVNKQFDTPNAIYAGAPCVMVKQGICWDRNRL